MGHFEDGSFAAGIDAEVSVIKGRDHISAVDHLFCLGVPISIERMRDDVGKRIEGIIVHDFTFAEFFADEPVELLLLSVRPFVPLAHEGGEEVMVLRFGV